MENKDKRFYLTIVGLDGCSSLEAHAPYDLGTISPDNSYALPILKSNNSTSFIYCVEYLNEINELMQFIIVAMINTTTNRIVKIYDILCKKRDEKAIKTPEIFSSSAWNDFKGKLGDTIVTALHHSVLEKETEWEYLSYTEKVIAKTCYSKELKNKLNALNICLNKIDEEN